MAWRGERSTGFLRRGINSSENIALVDNAEQFTGAKDERDVEETSTEKDTPLNKDLKTTTTTTSMQYLQLLGLILAIVLAIIAIGVSVSTTTINGSNLVFSNSSNIRITQSYSSVHNQYISIISLVNNYADFGFENNTFCNPTGITQYEHVPPIVVPSETDTEPTQENWYSVFVQNTIVNTDSSLFWLNPSFDSITVNQSGSYSISFTYGAVITDLSPTNISSDHIGSFCGFVGAIDPSVGDPYMSVQMLPQRIGMACTSVAPFSTEFSLWSPYVPINYISAGDTFFAPVAPTRLTPYFTFVSPTDVGVTIVSAQFKIIKIN